MMRLIGGILLVAGTTIGGGMLALPVATAQAGFFPSLLLFGVVWAFMAYTAFLFLEATLVAPKHANLVSMARVTLGPVGEVIAWASYMLLLYVLMAAYITGSGALLAEAIPAMPPWVGPLPWVLLFGAMVYLGIRSVDKLNRVLMVGLVVAYLILVVMLGVRVEAKPLMAAHLPALAAPLSLVVTTFGFHIIVPSLVDYLGREVNRCRLCLLIGCLIPLVVYIAWEVVVLGVVPKGELLAILKGGQPGPAFASLFPRLTGRAVLGPVMWVLSVCALLTSFLGVSISLADFLRDGLKVSTSRLGRGMIAALTFIPPLAFALLYPSGFVLALSYGGPLVAILLGLLPTAMVWGERYVRKKRLDYHVAGGKVALLLSFCFFLLVVIVFFMTKGKA
ncbi:MAG: amino acid permease [Parachlamydiales bacterium]